jgi:hypothetical protein
MDGPATPLHDGSMRPVLLSTCVCFAVYMLFAGTFSSSEAVTAAVVGIAGGAGALLLTRVSDHHFTFSAHHALAWGRAVRGMPAATARTGAALAGALLRPSPPSGRADTRPFRPGKETDPRDRARRVTAILAGSLTPSTFVVNLPLHRSDVLLHGIDRTAPDTDPEWLA